MEKELRKAYVALSVVSVVWGTTYLASRISAQYIPGFFVSAVRQFISGLILVSFFILKGHSLPGKKEAIQILIQGILLLCIGNGLSSWSVQYISSGLASIIASCVPLFIALFSIVFFNVFKMTAAILVGITLGLCGISIIFYEHLHQLLEARFSFGIVIAFIAALSWAFGSVYASRRKSTINILFSVGLQMLFAGCIMLPICLMSGTYTNLLFANHEALLSLGYLIIIGSLLTYSAYVFAISKLPATHVSIYAYFNPVIAIGLGGILLKEHLSANILLGTLVTLGGVYLVNNDFKGKDHDCYKDRELRT
jgi:drug/metabolite transporter (DMT)-like permease